MNIYIYVDVGVYVYKYFFDVLTNGKVYNNKKIHSNEVLEKF